ncbi:MAG TPA: ClpX C4-type zinc finger protein [Myxococcus sp.]|nr:ClpX C4-type zinc finger protein [Myxococcus sp.]
MADNPRELIRAAQSAELQGDVKRAVEYLRKAAELYRRAGNAPRALQLLRHARKLDGSDEGLADEVRRLEGMAEPGRARSTSEDAPGLERSREEPPLPELDRRQQLIEDALREAGMLAAEAEAEDSREHPVWVIESEVAEDLQRLEVQLARVAASVDPEEVAGEAGVAALSAEAVRAVSLATPVPTPGPEEPERAPPRRRREQRMFDRGPTRAEASLDAWCSFCCRPRTETGDLVAGPAGAFICKACLGESLALLGDVAPVPLPARPRPVEAAEAVMELVGQAEARTLLETALQAGARCLLVVGPEGCGKSVWFQQLQRQGQGALTPFSALEHASAQVPLLVEDVDRLDATAHAALATFLARNPRHTVLLSARGTRPEKSGPLLRGDAGLLPVPTTAALGQAVRGAVPGAVLEHVQVLLPLQAPTQAEYVEIARRRLALREPAVSLAEDALKAFAAEAVRSPRAGHELQALLNRVPAGTWRLETKAKPPAPARRKARRKRTP